MLGLTERQREALIEKLPDAGNLAAGSIVVGPVPRQEAFFDRTRDYGRRHLVALLGLDVRTGARRKTMIGVYIILGTMGAFAIIVAAIDLLGRRNERRSRDRAS